jgi:hypothetical protein
VSFVKKSVISHVNPLDRRFFLPQYDGVLSRKLLIKTTLATT